MGESEYYDDQNSTVGTFGSLKMALHFDTSLNILTVVLKQAVDLSSKRNSDELPNPYFKISLELPEPNETKSKMQHQSKVYHKTNSPLIDQEFFFQVPSDCDINSCRLEILISDFDKFSVDEDIGYCWLTLGRVNISEFKDKPTTFWAEVLTVKEVGSEFGEVLLSFTYLPKAQRLTVNVFKGRNLPISESESQTNLSVRISLVQISTNKKIKKKKTASKKSSCNHVQFNEPLNFNISNGLCDSLLEIELINEMGPFKMHQQVLAKLNLPLYKCKDLWKNIIHEDQIKGALPNGQTVLGCAKATCFGWFQNGSNAGTDTRFYKVDGKADGYLRSQAFDKRSLYFEKKSERPELATCEPKYNSKNCGFAYSWVGGISPSQTNGIKKNSGLKLKCCTYRKLIEDNNQDQFVAEVHLNQMVIGGTLLKIY
uniref:C2 domain-containing protein n=1 Tax=Rhabditophanes sp. KR3021 TaxID=114890 RepID=A0AC35UID4_9BILA